MSASPSQTALTRAVNAAIAGGALRHYQATGQDEPANRSDAIHDIATNGGEGISLDAGAIDDLCERLNH